MHSIVESYECLNCGLVIYVEEHLKERPHCARCYKDTLVEQKAILKARATLKDYFDLNNVMDVRVYNALRGTRFNTPEALYNATDEDLCRINRIGKKSKERIEQFKKEYKAAIMKDI